MLKKSLPDELFSLKEVIAKCPREFNVDLISQILQRGLEVKEKFSSIFSMTWQKNYVKKFTIVICSEQFAFVQRTWLESFFRKIRKKPIGILKEEEKQNENKRRKAIKLIKPKTKIQQ